MALTKRRALAPLAVIQHSLKTAQDPLGPLKSMLMVRSSSVSLLIANPRSVSLLNLGRNNGDLLLPEQSFRKSQNFHLIALLFRPLLIPPHRQKKSRVNQRLETTSVSTQQEDILIAMLRKAHHKKQRNRLRRPLKSRLRVHLMVIAISAASHQYLVAPAGSRTMAIERTLDGENHGIVLLG
jgi:hypothetical protein